MCPVTSSEALLLVPSRFTLAQWKCLLSKNENPGSDPQHHGKKPGMSKACAAWHRPLEHTNHTLLGPMQAHSPPCLPLSCDLNPPFRAQLKSQTPGKHFPTVSTQWPVPLWILLALNNLSSASRNKSQSTASLYSGTLKFCSVFRYADNLFLLKAECHVGRG